MAANLDYSNDRVNFAYVKEHGSVWHGEGNVLPLHAPLDDWKREAGMEWTAEESPIFFKDGSPDILQGFPSKKALFRSDTRVPLSVVGSDYHIVQPSEIVDFFSDILENHDMEMSSCGSLFGGKRFFATAKLNSMEIIPGDVINGYLLLSTSVDGSLATTAKTTSVRTVCSNTLTMALGEKSANVVKIPHSTAFDATKAKFNLGLIEENQFAFIEAMRKLAKASCDKKDALKIYQDMFYNKDIPVDEQHSSVTKKVDDIYNLYLYGNGSNYGKDTLYNVLQGVTDYYSNSLRSRNDSTRFWNSFYGSADAIKKDALDRLVEIV